MIFCYLTICPFKYIFYIITIFFCYFFKVRNIIFRVPDTFKVNTSCIFINQLREKIGVMFGNPETTTGGRALKFYSSVRIDIRRIGSIKKGDEVLGNRTKVKIAKNKVAPPFKVVEFNILYGQGISRTSEILDLAVEYDIIEKRGSWYRYDGEPIGQGNDDAMQFLEEDEELCNKIEKTVREKLMPSEEEGGEKAKSEEKEEKEKETAEQDE